MMGIEPTTFGLGGRCSTFELHGLSCSNLLFFFYLQIFILTKLLNLAIIIS